jgi:ligand-binding sensor domain-containing protein
MLFTNSGSRLPCEEKENLVNEAFPSGAYIYPKWQPQWWYCLILLSLIAAPAFAKERAFRVLDQSAGLPVSSLSGFAQDTDGFFWFGTAAGLYRFDGKEFRHWAKDKIGAPFFGVYAGSNGEVLLTRLPENTLYRVLDNEGVEIVSGPDGKPFGNIHDVAFTRDGRLWVSRLDALFYRNDHQQWVEMPQEIRGNEQIWKLSASFDGSLWVATTHNIWKIDPDLSYRKILTRNFEGYIGNVVAHPDGSFFYMEKYPPGGKIFQVHDGQVTERVALKTNLHDLVLRGETVWASGDSYLIALRSNRIPEVLHAGKDEPIGGGLVVDNEGSLWMTDGKQLFQLPEPETEIWTPREGLPDLGIIDLHETAEGIWVSTWRGLGHLRRGAGDEWHAYDDHLTHKGEMCSDGQGSLWLYDFHDFLQRWQGKFVRYRQPTGGWANGCDRGHDGRVWIATTRGLWHTQPGQSPPVLVSHPLGDKDLGAIFEDSNGRLWLTRNGDICHTRAMTINAGHNVEWTCDTIEGATSITQFNEQSIKFFRQGREIPPPSG